MENTDALAEDPVHRPDLDLFMHDLSSRGYEIKVFVLERTDFILPQARKGCFLVAVLRPGRSLAIDDYQAFFGQFAALIERVKRCGPSLAEVVLPDSDSVVEAVFQARSTGCAPSKLTTRTMDEHRAAWAAMGMRFTMGEDRISKADAASQWYQGLCAAKQARLQYHQHVRSVKLREAFAAETQDPDLVRRLDAAYALVDLHPSLSFISAGVLSASGQLCAPTVLPDCDIYLSIGTDSCLAHKGCEMHCALIGEEMLMLNGWCTRLPALRGVVAKRSNRFLADLGRNAFSSTIVAAMVCCLTFAAEMPDNRAATSSEGAADCMQLFKRVETDVA